MSARVILANIVVRLRTFSREKYAMFFTFAFPVILILVFGVIFATPERSTLALHVQDLDGSEASAQLIAGLESHGVLAVVHVPPDAEAGAYARDHGAALVLVIPRGFGEMHAPRPPHETPPAEPVELLYLYDPEAMALSDRLQFLHATLSEVNMRMFGTLPRIARAEAPAMENGRRFLEFFVPGIIAMAVMTASLYGALHISAELRQKGILRKLAATPITRSEWLLSNVLYQLVLAAISTLAILLVSALVFGVDLRINGWLVIFLVLTVFTFVGLGMLLTPIARDAESASAAGNALLFPMMFLSGTFFPIEMMPGVLQTVGIVLPLYHINEGLRAAMVFLDQAAAFRHAGIAAAFAAAAFVGGALGTRWDEGT